MIRNMNFKDDRYRYRDANRYRNANRDAKVYRNKVMRANVSGCGSVTVTVAIMLRLFPYNVAVAFLLRCGSDIIMLRLRLKNFSVTLALA